MTFALVLAALVGWWAWKRRETRALRFGDVAAGVAAIVGVALLRKHELVPALLALGGAAFWLWQRSRGELTEREMMPLKDARRVLGVERDADADTIRTAHRRIVAQVHPDAGGTDELTAQVNAARDALLASRARRGA